MNDNRRSHEASSLRAFFDEQIRHLQALISNLSSHVHSERGGDEDIQLVEGFVDAANTRLRAAHHYIEKLRSHVRSVYDHVLLVAEQIPDPVELSPGAFRTEPIINALFVNTEEIDSLLRSNPGTKAYLRDHSPEEVPVVYALLTASKSEKIVFGVGMLGDTLVREVRQQVVNFSSHKIHAPTDSVEALTTALKHYLFENIVGLVKQEMASRVSDQIFTSADHSYDARIKSLGNPDVYLDTLIRQLAAPADLLNIDKIHFRLNKMGVKLASDDDSQCANEFDIYELTWRNNARNILVKIAYPRQVAR